MEGVTNFRVKLFLTILNMFILEKYTLFVSLQCLLFSGVQNIQGAAMKPVKTLACNVSMHKKCIRNVSITISHLEPIAK